MEPKASSLPTFLESDTHSTGVGVAEISLDGEWIRVNERLCEILQCTGPLPEHKLEELIFAEDLPAQRKLHQSLLAGKSGSYSVELRCHCAGGEVVWVLLTATLIINAESRPKHCVLVVQDLTESRVLKRDLARTRLREKHIFTSLPIGAALVNAEGSVLRVNPELSRALDTPSEQIEGSPLADIVRESDREKIERCLARIRQGERGHSKIRTACRSVKGVEAPSEIVFAPAFDPDGVLQHVVVSVRDLQSQLRAEKAEREAAQARELSEGLIQGQEEEKRRIAQALHDDVGQRMAVMLMRASRVAAAAEEGSENRAECDRLAADLVAACDAIHSVVHDLHPAILAKLGLVGAVALHCEETEAAISSGPRVVFDAIEIPDAVPPDVALCLYRIMQESLYNAVKHAHAQIISVELRSLDDTIELTVHDDGIGFDADTARPRLSEGSLGVIGIHERAVHAGGEAEIRSERGVGTTVKVRLPIKMTSHLDPPATL